MIAINGKPIDLTNPANWNQPGVSITLKPGGSITETKNGVTTVVTRPTVQPTQTSQKCATSPPH